MRKKSGLFKEIENIDMEAVSRVAQISELDNIYLIESNSKRDPVRREPKGITLEHKCWSEISSMPETEDDNVLPVHCHFSVRAYHRGKPKLTLMSIDASFLALYNLSALDKIDRSDIEMFSKINPMYNTWPYWRELVQSFTVRMGYPALVIPLLKIQPKHAIKEERIVTKQKATSKKSLDDKG